VYLRLLCAYAPVWYMNLVFENVFRATGDTRTPFRVLGITLLFNFVVDPLLIHGPGPFPRLGVAGAGLATGLAQVVGALVYVAATRGHRQPVPFRDALRTARPRFAELGRLARVGLPMSSISIMFSAVYLVLSRITGEFGTGALAALGIVNRVESMAFLTVHGLGVATATLVGQNLGAGLVDRAERLAERANRLGMAAGAAAMLVFVLVPRQLVGLFTDDPQTLRLGSEFLRIVGYCQVLQAWELVLEGAFSGAGHTLPAMLISVPVSLLRIPVAWGLAVGAGLGPVAVWWTISVSAALRGGAILWWWRRGTWKTGHAPGAPPPPPVEGGGLAPTSVPADPRR
jgi:putative MATE family efflux protein